MSAMRAADVDVTRSGGVVVATGGVIVASIEEREEDAAST